VAHIVPAVFGIDTHTSDGERLLYFPSYFLCAIFAYVICIFAKTPGLRILFTVLLLSANVFFLKKNNVNWIKADAAINDIFSSIKNSHGNPIYFANMPDAIEGSFVFRNGFYEALQIHKISRDVRVLNYLTNRDAILLPEIIYANNLTDGKYKVAPFITIDSTAFKVDYLVAGKFFSKEVKRDRGAPFLFWNKIKVVSLLP
jgi:hypothetical protein